MKGIKRLVVLLLALVLCFSCFMTASAASKTVTTTFRSGIVYLTYEGNDSTGQKVKRNATGVVVGDIADPKDSVILCNTWLIGNRTDAVKVSVKIVGTGGATYTDVTCRALDDGIAAVSTDKLWDKITPLPLRAMSNILAGDKVQLLTNNGSAIASYTGLYNIYEPGVNLHRATFDKADIEKIGAVPTDNSRQIYTSPLYCDGIVGMGVRVLSTENTLFFRDAADIMNLLNANGIQYTYNGDAPVSSIVTTAPDATDAPAVTKDPASTDVTTPIETMTPTEAPAVNPIVKFFNSLSTGALIALIVAVIVIIGLIVFLVIYLDKKKKVDSGAMTAPVAGGSVPVSSAAAFNLMCVSGELAGKRYPLKNQLVIGRDPKVCQIVFSASTAGVSGVHCRVTLSGGQVTVTDLNSSYGTLLADGHKLTPNQPTPLRKGETFYLGSKTNGFTLQ